MSNDNRRAMMVVLAHATSQGIAEVVDGLFRLAERTNALRKTLAAMEDFEEETSVGVVVKPDGLKEAEAHLYNALDAMLEALEPDEDEIKRMTDGDEEAGNMITSMMLEARAKLADMRAARMED